MEDSVKAGFVAAFAVSGSVIILAHQVHKRLLSHFMKKFEFELRGREKHHTKKKVRFAEKVCEPLSDKKEYRKRHWMNNKSRAFKATEDVEKAKLHGCRESLEASMPINRLVLYKGIMKYNRLRTA